MNIEHLISFSNENEFHRIIKLPIDPQLMVDGGWFSEDRNKLKCCCFRFSAFIVAAPRRDSSSEESSQADLYQVSWVYYSRYLNIIINWRRRRTRFRWILLHVALLTRRRTKLILNIPFHTMNSSNFVLPAETHTASTRQKVALILYFLLFWFHWCV